MMNKANLKLAAEQFKAELHRHSKDDANVRALEEASLRLVNSAISGSISTPLQWGDVPGAYLFTEYGLAKYDSLETAYAEFKIELTGGPTDVLLALKKKMEQS